MFRGEGPPVQNPELKSAWYSDDQTWLVKLGPWALGQGAWQVGGLIMKGLTSLVKGFLTWKNWRVVGEQGKSHTHFGLNVPKIQVVELNQEPLVNWTYKTTYMLASVAGTLSLSLSFFFFLVTVRGRSPKKLNITGVFIFVLLPQLTREISHVVFALWMPLWIFISMAISQETIRKLNKQDLWDIITGATLFLSDADHLRFIEWKAFFQCC